MGSDRVNPGMPTRRGWLGGALGTIAAAPALGQAPQLFSSISVDVATLRAQGLGPYADSVASALRGELTKAFADRLGPGPRLLVRISGISMPSYVGGGTSRFGFGSTPNDYLDGEALVIGPKGGVLERHRQLSVLPSNSGGAWYDPQSEQRRLAALAAQYAGWPRRDL